MGHHRDVAALAALGRRRCGLGTASLGRMVEDIGRRRTREDGGRYRGLDDLKKRWKSLKKDGPQITMIYLILKIATMSMAGLIHNTTGGINEHLS